MTLSAFLLDCLYVVNYVRIVLILLAPGFLVLLALYLIKHPQP